MVEGEQIERAERILQVTYQEGSSDRQLKSMEVRREDFDIWLQHRVKTAMEHYWRDYKDMDPRVEAAWNTLLMHFFLVGLVCGRDERVGIE